MVGTIRVQFMPTPRVKALRRQQLSEHVSAVVLCCRKFRFHRVFCSLQRAGTAPRPRNCTEHASTQACSIGHPALQRLSRSGEKQAQQARSGCSPGTALPGSRPLCTLRHAHRPPPVRKHAQHLSAPTDACLQSIRACLARLGSPFPPTPPRFSL